MPLSRHTSATIARERRKTGPRGRTSRACWIVTLLSVVVALGCASPTIRSDRPDRPPVPSVAVDATLRRLIGSVCVDPADETLDAVIAGAISDSLRAARIGMISESSEQTIQAASVAAAGSWLQSQDWCLIDGDPLIAYLHEVSDYGDYITALRGERVMVVPPPWWAFWR